MKKTANKISCFKALYPVTNLALSVLFSLILASQVTAASRTVETTKNRSTEINEDTVTRRSEITTSTVEDGSTRTESTSTTSESRTQAPTFDGNSLKGSQSKSFEQQSGSSTETSSGTVGSTELKNAKTLAEQSVGVSRQFDSQGEHGGISGSVEAKASGSINAGDSGVELEGQLGLHAELAANLQQAWGDENIGASAELNAKVEAMIGAKGKAGFYFDENGITLGASVEAGAFVSAKAELSFEAHVFGVKATVTAWGEVHAGFKAQAEAIVTIGFNGKLSFKLSAGVSVGIGFSGGVSFDIDISDLMKKLNLPDMVALLEWIEAFIADPYAEAEKLVGKAANQMLGKTVKKAVGAFGGWFNSLVDNIDALPNLPVVSGRTDPRKEVRTTIAPEKDVSDIPGYDPVNPSPQVLPVPGTDPQPVRPGTTSSQDGYQRSKKAFPYSN